MKTLTLATCIALSALVGRSAPIMVISNYFPGYVAITSGWSTAENSGLVAGTAYVAIPISSLPLLTESNAVAGGSASDIRRLVYGVNEQVAQVYLGMATTNRPTDMVASTAGNQSGANIWSATHQIQTKGNMTLTLTPR